MLQRRHPGLRPASLLKPHHFDFPLNWPKIRSAFLW